MGDELATGSPFSYDDVPRKVVHLAKAAARRIRSRQRRATADLIDIGRDLLLIKSEMTHGTFGCWIAAEFGMTQRTAQNLMQAARCFGDRSETVSHLPAAAMYRLAAPSTPEAVRTEVVALVESGSRISAGEVKEMIRSSRQAAMGKGEEPPHVADVAEIMEVIHAAARTTLRSGHAMMLEIRSDQPLGPIGTSVPVDADVACASIVKLLTDRLDKVEFLELLTLLDRAGAGDLVQDLRNWSCEELAWVVPLETHGRGIASE